MMNAELMAIMLQECTYTLKEGTSSSYYRQSGSSVLPNRLGVMQGQDMPKTNMSGRQIHRHAVATLQGNYTQKEESPYKQHKPYSIRTTIWQSEDYPQFLGYGTLGITGADGKVTPKTDTNDLIIIYAEDGSLITLRIFILAGMGKDPDTLAKGLKYVATLI